MTVRIKGIRPEKPPTYWQSSNPRPTPKHLVADITFTKHQPADNAPMSCECGWTGTVAGWQAHGGKSVSRAWSEEGRGEHKPGPKTIRGTDEYRERMKASSHNGNKPACHLGHPFTPENTITSPTKYAGGVRRTCRACVRLRERLRYQLRHPNARVAA